VPAFAARESRRRAVAIAAPMKNTPNDHSGPDRDRTTLQPPLSAASLEGSDPGVLLDCVLFGCVGG
jgi:hypothetical protein